MKFIQDKENNKKNDNVSNLRVLRIQNLQYTTKTVKYGIGESWNGEGCFIPFISKKINHCCSLPFQMHPNQNHHSFPLPHYYYYYCYYCFVLFLFLLA